MTPDLAGLQLSKGESKKTRTKAIITNGMIIIILGVLKRKVPVYILSRLHSLLCDRPGRRVCMYTVRKHTGDGRHEGHIGNAQVGKLTEKPNSGAAAEGEHSAYVRAV